MAKTQQCQEDGVKISSGGYGGEGTATLERNGTLSYYYGAKRKQFRWISMAGSRRSILINKLTHVTLVRDFRRRTTWYINGVISFSKQKSRYTYAGRTSWALVT